jgi:hypothetical protein
MLRKIWTLTMLTLALLAATGARVHAQSQAQAGDELIIQHVRDTMRVAVVQMKQKIIVWTADGLRTKGRMTRLATDSVALDSVAIPLAQVTKVRAYSKEIGTHRMNAWAKRSAWVSLCGFLAALGGLIGAIAVSAFPPVTILLILLGSIIFGVSFCILLGTILAQVGANIPATTFWLKRGWRLKVRLLKKPSVKK